jgi:hypothetical protein
MALTDLQRALIYGESELRGDPSDRQQDHDVRSAAKALIVLRFGSLVRRSPQTGRARPTGRPSDYNF